MATRGFVRLRKGMRPIAGAVAALAVVVPSTGSVAEAAAAGCTGPGVRVADNFRGLPIAYGPGRAVVMKTTIYNPSYHDRTHAVLDYMIPSPNYRWAPAPSLAWRLGSGAWHRPTVRWFGGKGQKYWMSDDMGIGTLKARSTRSLQISITFHKGDPTAQYSTVASVGVRPCGDLVWDTGIMHARYKP